MAQTCHNHLAKIHSNKMGIADAWFRSASLPPMPYRVLALYARLVRFECLSNHLARRYVHLRGVFVKPIIQQLGRHERHGFRFGYSGVLHKMFS